tara:strand:+ start:2457 stop:2732 length:276 start_codon:yes stop_codon:yes gene_type:complete
MDQLKTKIEEKKVLIANRIPPGDKWRLADEPNGKIHKNLTDALEAYMQKTDFRGHYRLEPLESKLYAINAKEVEVPKPVVKRYSIYGEYGE